MLEALRPAPREGVCAFIWPGLWQEAGHYLPQGEFLKWTMLTRRGSE